jgi:hypothetical protein
VRAIVLFLFGTLCFAATPDNARPNDDLKRQEVEVVRLINTAAVHFQGQNNRPPTWDELVAYVPQVFERRKKHGFDSTVDETVVNLKDPSNFYPGHKIR